MVIQEFWYNLEDIKPIPLDENQLKSFRFYQRGNEWGC